AETLAAARELPGAAAAWPLLAHAGSGIVRAAVPADAYGRWPGAEWAAALAGARSRLAERGGTVLCVRAPRDVVGTGLDPFGDPGPALRLMRALKKAFDPAGVLAAGRFVLGGSFEAEDGDGATPSADRTPRRRGGPTPRLRAPRVLSDRMTDVHAAGR